MSRPILLLALLAGLMPWLMFGEVSKGFADSQAAAKSRAVIQMLDEPFDLGPLQQADMNLKEFLGLFMEMYAAKGRDLPIIADNEAFKKRYGEFYIYDTILKFPSHPKRMPAIEMLRLVLTRSEKPATFLIRGGMVVIVPKSDASAKELLKLTVAANFDGKPLTEALDELSAMTGASIVLDGRLDDKAKKPITATLKNDVSLGAALRVLTDIADLKVVVLDSGIYVTSPASAQAMLKELEQQRVPEKQRRKKSK